MGIKKAYPSPTIKDANGKEVANPAYESLSPSQKQQAEQQSSVESSGKIWVDMTEPVNEIMKNYVTAEGKFDAARFEDENSSNTTLMSAYNALKNLDTYSRDKFNQAKAGTFNSKGLSVALPESVNADDFKVGFVDFAKGISPGQLVQAGMFSEYTGDVFNPKVTNTGEANDLIKARINEAGANYRARLQERGANARAKGGGGSDKSPDVLEKPAMLFGEHITRLKNFFVKKPNEVMIVPYSKTDDKTRIAANLQEGQQLEYKSNGTYDVVGLNETTKKKEVIRTGTIDNLAQGFIESVKKTDAALGEDKDGTMAEGFQIKSENKFKELFGTTSGQSIWDNWGGAKEQTTTTATEAPKELSGNVDPKTFKTGQSYSVGGKTYIWNGTKLKPQ